MSDISTTLNRIKINLLTRIKRLRLRTQLTLLMLSLTLTFIITFEYLHQINQERIFNLIEEQIDDLSKAIQISVEQITTIGDTDEERLKDYITKLKKKGFREISILSNDQKVIISSNPRKIGAKLSIAKNELLIHASLGGNDGILKKVYNVIVPVVIRNTQLGYVHLSLYLEDFDKLSNEMFVNRIFTTLLILGIGIGISMYISYRYTKPISELIKASKDISEGKIQQVSGDFSGEVGELMNSFNQMALKLKERLELEEHIRNLKNQALLGQLASGIAHEIRNPANFLTLTIDYINTLEIDAKNANTPEIKNLIKRMKDEISRINQMVSNFLDLGKELILEPVKIKSNVILDEIIESLSTRLKTQNITVIKKYSEPVPTIFIDIDKMKSCFMNIITNSIEAMPEGGKLSIEIKEENGFVEFAFIDTGEGIKNENIDRIFEPFFTTKRKGIGIGLAISKRVVLAHKGCIEANSIPGKGTCIKVKIPLKG